MSSQAVSPVRVAVLISGTGSNMAALIDAGQAADSGYEVALVLSKDRTHRPVPVHDDDKRVVGA